MNNNCAIAECIEFPNRINMNSQIESTQLNVLNNVIICS
jgi:hypothetical protein